VVSLSNNSVTFSSLTKYWTKTEIYTVMFDAMQAQYGLHHVIFTSFLLFLVSTFRLQSRINNLASKCPFWLFRHFAIVYRVWKSCTNSIFLSLLESNSFPAMRNPFQILTSSPPTSQIFLKSQWTLYTHQKECKWAEEISHHTLLDIMFKKKNKWGCLHSFLLIKRV
jgi:hypothetical protein